MLGEGARCDDAIVMRAASGEESADDRVAGAIASASAWVGGPVLPGVAAEGQKDQSRRR